MYTEGNHIKYHLSNHKNKPKRVLIIRLQATGDVIIMLPYIQSLRNQLPPETQIDLIVREECKNIPINLNLFNNVYVMQGKRNTKLQLLHFLFVLFPKMIFKKYDILFDLQNHNLSRVMRFLLRFSSYSIFDRTSTNYAGDRYKNTINVLNFSDVRFEGLNCFKGYDKSKLFSKFNLSVNEKYIVLNPAGAFQNRNWKLENYVEFANQLLELKGNDYKFLIIGIDKVKEAGKYFKSKLGNNLIDIVGKTSQLEAMLILREMKLVVSEDSGLFHMSYVVGTPTIGIFGSTRNDWTNPNLPHTYCFNSSHLECGNCMLEKCLFSEIKCLESVKPEMVLTRALKLLETK